MTRRRRTAASDFWLAVAEGLLLDLASLPAALPVAFVGVGTGAPTWAWVTISFATLNIVSAVKRGSIR